MQSVMIFQRAKKADMVELLSRLGFMPDRVKGNDHWYRSPFRSEHTASFKVNRDRNIWYDHGEGVGGNIIDFAARFFRCSPEDGAKKILELHLITDFSFHQPSFHQPSFAGEKKEADRAKIRILRTGPLQNASLLAYLHERQIPLSIAIRYCKEVDFLLNDKKQYAIGFENRSGGFELRNKYFKGSSAPKDIAFFDNGKREVYVFEGFFDFLSFAVIRPQEGVGLTNSLVLNSLSFFEKSRSLMEQHDNVHLFLDRGKAGRLSTQKALEWNKAMRSAKYRDGSNLYQYRDDLNVWLVAQPQQKQQQQPIKKTGRRL